MCYSIYLWNIVWSNLLLTVNRYGNSFKYYIGFISYKNNLKLDKFNVINFIELVL